jgi:hypothetical protein
MSSTDVQKLAEKIAAALAADAGNPDLATLFASIDKINHRLDKLEKASFDSAAIRTGPQLLDHPSLDRFDIVEAVADELTGGTRKEKACTFEPNGKPCDHCAMCSSRGF